MLGGSGLGCLRRLLLGLALFFTGIASWVEAAPFDPFSTVTGPQMKDLYYVVIRDADAQLLALSTGKVDVLGEIYRATDVERLNRIPEVELSLASSFHGFFITFNTRKFPWDQKILRQAASQVVERKRWVRDLFSGFAEPLTGFLPHVSPYYAPAPLLPQGVDAARRHLSDAGWSWNASGILVAPDGREVPQSKILCPPSSVVATTAEIAQLMADALNAIGVPVEVEPMDFQTLLARVDERNFDLSTTAWSMTRDPDNLYAFYHSSSDVKGGYNQSGLSDPALDTVLDALRYAPDEPHARRAATEAQLLLADLMPAIPLYSRYSLAAIRRDWEGVFSNDRTTVDNLWTLLSMRPRDGGERPVFWALPEEVRALNPLVSSTAYDWSVLGTVYESLIAIDPYTFEDIPWIAESWDVAQGEPGTVLTFWLRPGLQWQDGHPLTAEDVAYTLNYIRENAIPRFYDQVKDIASIDVPDELTLRISMKNTSFWHLHNVVSLILPKHILQQVSDWRTWQPTLTPHTAVDGTVMTELVGTGPFIFKEYRVGEYVHMTRNPRYMLFKNSAGEERKP